MITLPKKFASVQSMKSWLADYVANIDNEGVFIDRVLGDRLADEFSLYFGTDPYNAGFISDDKVVCVPEDYKERFGTNANIVLIRRTIKDSGKSGIVGAVQTTRSAQDVEDLWKYWCQHEPASESADFADWFVKNYGGKSIEFLIADVEI